MNPSEIKGLLEANPFTPFKLILNAGQEFEVPHHDFLHVTRNGSLLYEGDSQTVFLNPRLVASVVMLPDSSAA